MVSPKPIDVAIVGGSIAGCSAAILLERAGHRVRVYERSTGDLVGRGGGIGTPAPVLCALIEQDILDADFPHLVATEMPFVVRTADEPRLGRRPWAMPLDLAAFHWSSLWHALRSRIPDDRYRQGAEVVAARTSSPGRGRIELADGSADEADLVVFADGYRSLGRRTIFPEVEIDYRGYMLWRGLLPESAVSRPEDLGATMPRISFPGMPGNMVAYLVPGPDGSTHPGERLVNWASYIPLERDEVDAFMVDRSGRPRVGTIPPGLMRPEEESRLTAAMLTNLPDLYGEIVAASRATYVQLIYTVRVPAYHHDRICLIGDAGSLAPPFTGSGVFKGHSNITSLVAELERQGDVDRALDVWSQEQVAAADRLLALGEQMERAFIHDPLDLTDADAASVETWWREAVTFPEDFTYEGR